ncbi:hypothetical protein MKEN_00595600 [Mycena kentingensis (nom. inval.)]|nr:hypothetical protein MKEN_00595600 [Mycena kentingensis (nom. inval.)]
MAHSDIVIREVTTDVWTFSQPFYVFSYLPIGGRSTAIKLANGDVWVLASTPLSPETKDALDKLGRVAYLVAVNMYHNMYLPEFKAAYPDAKLLGPKAAVKRCPHIKFDGAWGLDEPGTRYGFEDEIDACYFTAFSNQDVVFLHRASGTLIQADLLTNLPGTEQWSKCTSAYIRRFPFYGPIGKPASWVQRRVMRKRVRDVEKMKADVKTVIGWAWDRVIPCHGDVIESGGKQAWRDAMVEFLPV